MERSIYCIEVNWFDKPICLLETHSIHEACKFLKTINMDVKCTPCDYCIYHTSLEFCENCGIKRHGVFNQTLQVRFFRHHPYHEFNVSEVLEVLSE